MAQLVARRVWDAEALGSNPSTPTNKMRDKPAQNLWVFILGGILVIALLSWFFFNRNSSPKDQPNQTTNPVYLEIGNTRVNVEIANTVALRSQGLGGRDELAAGWGMLFVFEKADRYPFWMKDVAFPLDIIWIAEDWRILGFEERVLPSSYPTTFRPSRPVLYVLEVNSGFVAESQVTVGETVKLVEDNQ